MSVAKVRDPDAIPNSELEVSVLHLVVMHRPAPLSGHDPMRVCLDALHGEQDVIVLDNGVRTSEHEVDVPPPSR